MFAQNHAKQAFGLLSQRNLETLIEAALVANNKSSSGTELNLNMAKPCLGDTVEVVSNETIYVGVLSAIDVRKGRLSLDKG